MNRSVIANLTHNAKGFLNLDNNEYKQWVFRYTFLELDKDLGLRGDVTSRSVFEESRMVKARIMAKEDGVFAGGDEVRYFLVEGNKGFRPKVQGDFQLEFLVRDGERFESGDVLAELSGDICDILAVERVVLNLLMRMSGVATFAARMCALAGGEVLVTPTRKTLWGLLDKRAAALGGCGTHRLNLADAILIKDTHLDACGRDFGMVLDRVFEAPFLGKFVEVEVESVDEAVEAAKFLVRKVKERGDFTVGALLLDNMSALEVERAVERLKAEGLYDDLLLEASGGINEGNIAEYAKTGVDIVSMGCLTTGARSLDLSLKVVGF